MIKCITLMRGEVDDVGAVVDSSHRPLRLAVCRVRQPSDITAVVLSWHAEESNVPEHVGGWPTTIVEERVVNGDEWLDDRWNGTRGEWYPLLIGLIRRAPHLSREEFSRYWWDEHRPLAHRLVPRDFAPVAYVHNYVRPDQISDWDGIGELYEGSLNNARDRGRWFASESGAPMLEDEDRFMVRAARQVLVTDFEIVLR